MDTAQSNSAPPAPDDPADVKVSSRGGKTGTTFNHPEALSDPIALIEQLIEKEADPGEGIQQLCARAVANPGALIEPAGNYLAHLIAAGRLSSCPDVPASFLVEELALGSVVVTPLVLSRWEEAKDTSRIVRLADGLAGKESRLSGPEAGEFALKIALIIAIQKPVRSLRLIEIARPLVKGAGHQPLLEKALQWQAAGDFLSGDGRIYRSFWQERLTKPESTDWENDEAVNAVKHLKRARGKGEKIPPVLVGQIPQTIWNPEPVEDKPATRSNPEAPPPQATPSVKDKPVPIPEPAPQGQRQKSGFLSGFLIGGSTMLLAVMWLGKDSIIQKPAPQPLVMARSAPLPASIVKMEPPAVPPPVAIESIPIEQTAKVDLPVPAAPKSEPPTASTQPPPAPPAPLVAVIAPKEQPPAKSAPVEARASPSAPAAAVPVRPEDEWRKAEFAALAQKYPNLVRWHGTARSASWQEAGSLVQGLRSFLPYTGDEYPLLLKLLLLDPPADADVAAAVPKMAARRMKTAELLPLWERLVYPGSPNERQIREAAVAYLSMKKETLGPSSLQRLEILAGKASLLPSQ